MRFNKEIFFKDLIVNSKKYIQKLTRYTTRAMYIILPISLFLIIVSFYPASMKIADLTSYIALITQVLSVLVGFSFVGTTLYLSGYTISDKVSDLLHDIEKNANEIRKTYLDGPPKQSKIVNNKFVLSLMNRVGINQLEFYDVEESNKNNSKFYVFRPYWDGVWYQIMESPLFDKNKSKEDLHSIRRLHELVICSAKLIGIITELRENNINLIKKKNGTNGSVWFIEVYEQLIKEFPSLKEGQTPESMKLTDAIKLVRLAIHSNHYGMTPVL